MCTGRAAPGTLAPLVKNLNANTMIRLGIVVTVGLNRPSPRSRQCRSAGNTPGPSRAPGGSPGRRRAWALRLAVAARLFKNLNANI